MVKQRFIRGYSLCSYIAMRAPILIRSKILKSSDIILGRDVRFFCDGDLSTFLPESFVPLNSKHQKSLMLFGEAMRQHSARYHPKSWRNLKYIDRMETSRRLFAIRSLIWEYQLDVRFYSIFEFWRTNWNGSRWEGKRGPMDLSPRVPMPPRWYLHGRKDPMMIRPPSLEYDVRFYYYRF